MGFKILNEAGQALTMKELDQQAAELWNKTVDPKWYAAPHQPVPGKMFSEGTNWFDSLGWKIHQHKCVTWNNLRDEYKADAGRMSSNGVEFDIYIEIFEPYFKLIAHWESKGYKPKPVE